jgi:hypothetical protein
VDAPPDADATLSPAEMLKLASVHPGASCGDRLHRDLWRIFPGGRLVCVHPAHQRPTGAVHLDGEQAVSAAVANCMCGAAVWQPWRHLLLCARCGARANAEVPWPSRPMPYYAHRACVEWCWAWTGTGWVAGCEA